MAYPPVGVEPQSVPQRITNQSISQSAVDRSIRDVKIHTLSTIARIGLIVLIDTSVAGIIFHPLPPLPPLSPVDLTSFDELAAATAVLDEDAVPAAVSLLASTDALRFFG